MNAVVFDGELKLADVPVPKRADGEVLIRVSQAGICNTDLEIICGYVPGFNGILGHEFTGVVQEADDSELYGKRVSAEINIGCGTCDICAVELERYCPRRSVLGIAGRDGVLAEYVAVPLRNVVRIPESIPDSTAIFIEPLAASLEILQQIHISRTDRVLLIGDGKLAQLIGRVLAPTHCSLSVVGKHSSKLALLEPFASECFRLEQFNRKRPPLFDIVVEASGGKDALAMAIDYVQPRGNVVLKSTYAGDTIVNASKVVVDEVTIIGSRCGRFADALEFIQCTGLRFDELITERLPLRDACRGFARARDAESLKVVLTID